MGFDNVTVVLDTTAEWEGVTSVRISNQITFKFTVTLPNGTFDLQTALWAPKDGGEPTFSFCSYKVDGIGSNFGGISSSAFFSVYSLCANCSAEHSYQVRHCCFFLEFLQSLSKSSKISCTV